MTGFPLFLICSFPFVFLEFPGDRQTVIQAAIIGENLPFAAHGDGTDQHINRANLEALTPAFVVKPSCMLVIGSVDSFINEWSKGRLNLFVPQGAATIVWCAASPQLNGMGGVYCENCDIAPMSTAQEVADLRGREVR